MVLVFYTTIASIPQKSTVKSRMHDAFAQTYTAVPTPQGMIWDTASLSDQMPMELVLTALVRCTILTLDSILSKQRHRVTRYRVHVTGRQRLQHPQVWESVALTIHCAGTTIDHAGLERALHIVPRYCPVHATIAQTTDLTHQIAIDTAAEDVT